MKYPGLKFDRTDSSLTVYPKDETGFPVTLQVHTENALTVYCDLWHEDFTQAEAALDCFSFGLSNQCRLKVAKRGGKPYKWTLEYLKDGTWWEESEMGLLNYNFWTKTTVQVLQNDLFKLD